MAAELTTQTPAGVLAYCDYLIEKGYATASQVNPWRTAIQKVFETVEGSQWESIDLTDIDLEEYLGRFRTLAGSQYRAESVTTYGRRVRNALDAQAHYIATGRPPSFRRAAKKASDSKDEPGASVVKMPSKQSNGTATTSASTGTTPTPGMTDFPFPLGDGRMVTLRLPSRIKSDDVNRLCAFIRTLQDDSAEPRQLPRRAGDDEEQAA